MLNVRRSISLILLGILLVALPGCQPQNEVSSGGEVLAKESVVTTYSNDFLSCRQTIDSAHITSAQQLKIILHIETREGYGLSFPTVSHEFGEFAVTVAKKGKLVFADDGRVAQEVVYLLDPPGPGEYQIPALTISSWDKGVDEAEVVELTTEKVQINVASLFTGTDSTIPPELNDILPPVAQPFSRLLIAGVALGGLLLIAAIVWFVKKPRKEEAPPPPVPAHIRAGRALDRLLNEQLVAKGEVKLFYARVSDILRYYIEERFGAKAPERTTEEFLSELGKQTQSTQPVLVAHKALISKFLTHCDLVKFAEHQPKDDEVDMAVSICREFIDATKPVASLEQPDGKKTGSLAAQGGR